MNWSQQSPQLLLFSVIAVWCIGFVAMVAGKSLKTHTASITAIVTSALLLILMSAAFFLLVRDFGGTQHLWTRGWIGPRDLEGAITVGILEDPLGLAMIVLSSVLTLIFVSSRWLAPQGEVRHYAGAVLGLSGVSLAWLSSTPWLAFIGIGIITLAGFVGLGVDENREAAEKISRFGRERAWGLIFAILGAAVLAGQRGALGFQLGFAFPAQRLDSFFDLAGGALLLTGLYLHLQPFPFLGWLVSDSGTPRVLLNQIFPALGVFALAIRFQPELQSVGLLPIFGGWALFSALLSVISGLSQNNPKTALSLSVSSAFSIAYAALCWGGVGSAILILIAASLSAFSLSYVGSIREAGFKHGSIKVALVLSTLMAAGMFGFVASAGYLRFAEAIFSEPLKIGALVFVLMAQFLLLWKVGWAFLRVEPQKAKFEEKALSLVWTYLLIIFSLALFWVGTFSGGIIPGNPDQVMPSWLALAITNAFGGPANDWVDASNLGVVQGVYWATAGLALLLSYWIVGRGEDGWLKLFGKSEKAHRFFDSGYGFDRLGARFVRVLVKTGDGIESFFGKTISTNWIPKLLVASIRAPAIWIDSADNYLYGKSGSVLKRGIEIPGKLLQLIQNGDVQWYLFFAMSCALAILIHFLRA
jgi:formate hydrogenlyase subunit 3/multisubunit Na+/H+ antiporter MnhD subunit